MLKPLGRSHWKPGGLAAALTMLLLPCLAPAVLHAREVPLDIEIPFAPVNPQIEKTAILVVSDDLRMLVVNHRRMMMRFDFPIGKAATANLTRALESLYERVELTSSRPADLDGPLFELTAVDVTPKFPATTFGTYGASVSLSVTGWIDGAERSWTVNQDGSSRRAAGRVVFQPAWRGMKQDWVELGKATGFALADALDELLIQLAEQP